MEIKIAKPLKMLNCFPKYKGESVAQINKNAKGMYY